MTKKGQKSQITKLFVRSEIIRREEAPDNRFSKKYVSRSFKVIEGSKIALRDQSLNCIKSIQMICQNEALDASFSYFVNLPA